MAITQLKPRSFDIRESLGYLISNVRQEWIGTLDVELKPLDLTAAQYIVMLNVGSGRAETPVHLCRLLQYDTGAMTRLVDRIEAKGLIRRAAHGADRRCVVLELTAAGHELYPRLVQIAIDMNKRALKGFTREEAAALENLLKRVALNVAA
ncbi:MAG TPA: MarR family transcriptional regulator [Usitatibacter sp.]|jgi:DNA-binding MarR family transcriptional regulator|nr:MarR family transcriptional regulator [Usitatibacter sp.]